MSQLYPYRAVPGQSRSGALDLTYGEQDDDMRLDRHYRAGNVKRERNYMVQIVILTWPWHEASLLLSYLHFTRPELTSYAGIGPNSLHRVVCIVLNRLGLCMATITAASPSR